MHLLDHVNGLLVALNYAISGLAYVSRPLFYAHIIGFNMKVITNLTSKEHMSFDVAIVADDMQTSDKIKISRIKRLNTNQLFTDVKEVMIEHLNETYILRITKQNKLILTK